MKKFLFFLMLFLTGVARAETTSLSPNGYNSGSSGYLIQGLNGVSLSPVSAGNLFYRALRIGPNAGAAFPTDNNYGGVAAGVSACRQLSTSGAEATCVGSYASEFVTSAFLTTAIGEHSNGWDNASYVTMGGGDAGRDTVGNTNSTGWGAQTQVDGTGSSNTTLGAFALRGNGGSIVITGTLHIGDVLAVPFTTTNGNVKGLPATASFTLVTAVLSDAAAGLAAAISSLGVYYQMPDGGSSLTENGTTLGAYNTVSGGFGNNGNVVTLHFPGGTATGWAITPGTPTCTGNCAGTVLTVKAPFGGQNNVVAGVAAMVGAALVNPLYNVVLGDGAGASLQTNPTSLAYLGYQANYLSLSDDHSVRIGAFAYPTAGTSHGEIGIGASVGTGLTAGYQNILIQDNENGEANSCITTGARNLQIGVGACVFSPTTSFQASIMNSIYLAGASATGASQVNAYMGLNQPNPQTQFHSTASTGDNKLTLDSAGTNYVGLGTTTGAGGLNFLMFDGGHDLWIGTATSTAWASFTNRVKITTTGYVDASVGYKTNGAAGLASKVCTIASLGATITITGGIVTATTGC